MTTRSFSVRARSVLSANKERLLTKLLPNFLFSQERIEGKHSPIALEIGFGDGANLVNLAQCNQGKLFIGAEPYRNGVARLLSAMESRGLANILIWPQDVNLMLHQMPCNALREVYILFPDPWPKKRHVKRRLMSIEFFQLLSSRLESGGRIYFASDSNDYCKQVQALCLDYMGEVSCSDQAPYEGYLPTKYHRKAESQVSFLSCKKA